ncbi:MAG: LysE family translocator [Rhizobiales bacterium]|nr:LysE family translocator [Hyphomicrobiales bacterium]
MSFEIWLTFTFASIVVTLIPGPSVLLVISQALTKGTSAAMACIAGDLFGTVILILLSLLGVGALLAASAVLFQIVKWGGVFYLAYLGYRQILDARNESYVTTEEQQILSSWQSFWAGSITAILNPKAIIFYMAFLAQFIDPTTDIVVQMVILTTTSTIVVAVLLAGYALLAVRAGATFRSRSARQRIGYTGGSIMIGGSALMAATR